MKSKSITESKSFDFALQIILIYKHLIANKNEYTLSKQILRSGTSIGANVAEAIGGYSKNDFKFKISLAYKEAKETEYWLKLLESSQYLTTQEAHVLLIDVDELLKLLGSTLLTINKAANK
jgi:four helix bundle protein